MCKKSVKFTLIMKISIKRFNEPDIWMDRFQMMAVTVDSARLAGAKPLQR